MACRPLRRPQPASRHAFLIAQSGGRRLDGVLISLAAAHRRCPDAALHRLDCDYRRVRHRSLLNPVELSYTHEMVKHLLTGVAFAIISATAAFAQTNVPGPIATPDGQAVVRGHRKYEPGPAGVPGARAEPALVAPPDRDRVPGDMPPTEALFDSINRGDTVAAREAIGRGADIQGRNVLGLTALEQAVDLGRNDISFLLLSLRGGAGFGTTGGPQATQANASSPAATRAQRQAEARETAKARRQQVADDRASRSTSTAPVAARNARLFAGDGGAPVPQAGFLGFDSAR